MATLKEINSTYPDLQISKQTVHRFYKIRESGEQYEGRKPGSGAQAFEIDEELTELIEQDPYLTCKELGRYFGCDKSTIHRHLLLLGYTSKWNTWLPHKPTPNIEAQRFKVAETLLYRQIATPFLDLVVTADEKWILCNNKGKKNVCLSIPMLNQLSRRGR